MNNKIIWFTPAVLVALGIFMLSTFLTIPIQVEGVGYFDKVQHSFAYFVLAISFLIAFRKSAMLNSKRSLHILIASSLYGLGLELAQYSFFPNRYFEWIDAVANVLGVLIGFIAFKLIDRG